MTYFFIGPPASGKGTQAKLLAQHLGIPFYSLGALLREKSQTDPALAAVIAQGDMVKPEVIHQIIDELAHEPHEPLVLDGNMRNTEQAEYVLTHWKRGEIRVILIDIPDDEIVRRALKRVENGIRRDDDTLEIVTKRIETYRSSIAQILAILQRHNIAIIKVDGVGDVDAIQQKIQQKL